MTLNQFRMTQVQVFDGAPSEVVFRAFKTILQDEGYTLKRQSPRAGLLVAAIQKTDQKMKVWATFGDEIKIRPGDIFEVNVVLARVDARTTESRLTVQRLEQYSLGGQQGEEIAKPEIYVHLYDRVKTELRRRGIQIKAPPSAEPPVVN